METETYPPLSFKAYLPAFLLLIIVGGAGLVLVTLLLLPTLGPRWLFFFFLLMLVSGLALPITYFLNLRFPSKPPAERNVIVRQAVWIGVYVTLLAWLQMGRILTFPLAFILAAALVLIEVLLRLWERSRWKPQTPTQ